MDGNCIVDETKQELNYGQIFFMLCGMLPFFMLLPPLLVAKLVWEPMEKQRLEADKLFKLRRKEWIKSQKGYEYQYTLKENCDTHQPKISNILLEHTPNGTIAMRYNKEEEGFEYWADKDIPYKILETVARKYVNTFHCTGIYINRLQLLKEKIEKLTDDIKANVAAKEKLENENEENSEEEKEDDKKSVFASLKEYNTTIEKKSSERERLKKSDFVCETANKYIKKGKLGDPKEWSKTKDKEEKPTSSTLNWLSWKTNSCNV